MDPKRAAIAQMVGKKLKGGPPAKPAAGKPAAKGAPASLGDKVRGVIAHRMGRGGGKGC